MIWETRVIVYQDVEAETYEEACAIAKKNFEAADTHHENFEVDAYLSPFDWLLQEALESGKHVINDEVVPPLDECFEPGRPVNDIMALNP